jgi:hypothetical protein
VTLLDVVQLREVLDGARNDLLRWETLPAYEVASDGTDYRRYLDGAAEPNWQRKQPWLDTLRAWADAGRARRRVRVIHDPITPYERYSSEWGYALNTRAGEIVRVIDLAEVQLPPELSAAMGMDFWLIDGRDAVAMDYAPDGQFRGAQTVDPKHTPSYLTVAEVAWHVGREFDSWWEQHPQHHRSAHRAA